VRTWFILPASCEEELLPFISTKASVEEFSLYDSVYTGVTEFRLRSRGVLMNLVGILLIIT
jgi:hypothetical protein